MKWECLGTSVLNLPFYLKHFKYLLFNNKVFYLSSCIFYNSYHETFITIKLVCAQCLFNAFVLVSIFLLYFLKSKVEYRPVKNKDLWSTYMYVILAPSTDTTHSTDTVVPPYLRQITFQDFQWMPETTDRTEL